MSTKQYFIPLLLTLLLVPFATLAQEQTPASAGDNQSGSQPDSEQTRRAESPPEPAVSISSDKPPSRFIPTEEISEDFSVSFPVDI